ncbi:hypothetical protein VE25_13195 [Devosia geojensis]|uniref:Oxidoreductase n=1 Tax=Devosia geojensis TaxID=443610 RepID=A0A0F5FQY6_9HYPH|nr:Gfo/Idh/MocA family oxidoreductase [Devosia geojensis]KKB11271.1 hypothetical protein VE25_13195 [Devosia geojensis]
MRYRIAVVGARIGAKHVEAIRALPDRYELSAVCDLDRVRAARIADKVPIVADYARLLEQNDIDIVALCTPSHLHLEQTLAAQASGRHVVCEKPVAATIEELDRLAAAVRETNCLVFPVLQKRHGNGLQRLRYLADRNLLGRLYVASAESHWSRGADYYANPWRGRIATEPGGTLMTHAIHQHDMMLSIVGPVRSVFARIATRVHDIETEDCASIVATTEDGGLLSLSATVGSHAPVSRLRFCFEHLTAESSSSQKAPHHDPWTFTPAEPMRGQIEAALADFAPGAEDYVALYRSIHADLETGRNTGRLDEFRPVLALTQAAYQSAREGHEVTLSDPLRAAAVSATHSQ